MSESSDPFVWLWPYPKHLVLDAAALPAPQSLRITGESPADSFITSISTDSSITVVQDEPSDTELNLRIDPNACVREGYRLTLQSGRFDLIAADRAGLSYGCNTLLQIMHTFRNRSHWPSVTIDDEPALPVRAAMVDLGRTIAGLPMLKRLVRVFHNLRYNRLHLRLYDDELCGLKFVDLPFGHDNPYAITLDELGELVSYAAEHHIQIIPELEGWGHVGAITYHRPDLRGGPGMFAGSSFLVGEQSISLMQQLVDQVASVSANKASVHLGFDEANWFTAPDMPEDYAPADLLDRYYKIVQQAAQKYGKDLTMEIHADHAGRTVPDSIRKEVVVHPWQYWIANREQIDRAIERYGRSGAGPWMMSVGQSLAQYRGAYLATRYFCQHVNDCTDLRGATVCMWGWNDWDRLFITYFAGAQYLWNPSPPTIAGDNDDHESCDRFIYPIMHTWQAQFADARPEALERDRGPLVFRGFYQWGPDHGKPVSPSAEAAGTFRGHDFVNEAHLLKPKS